MTLEEKRDATRIEHMYDVIPREPPLTEEAIAALNG